FRSAVDKALGELRGTRGKVAELLGDELADIFEAHALLLADPSFLNRIVDRIRGEKVNAEWAVHKATEELGAQFSRLENTHLRERADDLRDVGRYLLRNLKGLSHHDISELEGDLVIVADDLTPSEAVRLGRAKVVAFAVDAGGPTSHTTIIARSLRIPLVAGLEGVTRLVTTEDPVIVDGDQGRVILHPTKETLRRYRNQQKTRAEEEEEALLETPAQACSTADGKPVRLMANIDLPEELEAARQLSAAGVGLYRSEFLYIEASPRLPSEEDHLALYRTLIETMAPNPVTIRTFDLGGRKLAREVLETHEDNPVLGLRGIRLTLARPGVFKQQLRALFRAARLGDLRIMLPLVSSLDEVARFRSFAAEIMEELEAEGTPFSRNFQLGVMIEVPSAAIIADVFARNVDFFAIGTNDLVQYSLAVDRNNENVSYLCRPFHPAILRMIRWVVRSARENGIDVSICGEIAGDPKSVPLLVGLGLHTLSMAPHSIPAVRRVVARSSAAELEGLAERCLNLETAAAVEAEVAAFNAAIEMRPDDPKASESA
ncbi:MAG TPA: phosphoenolpyruvate--protein phosphotransferase, partial [Thermoanaerobaculia bacterium]|nr:phosphoenolpyruvate--protein phosphotransferase [Thermoanaerobaculia bacterium]